MTYDGYAGVVYDLDGTLVRLAVDWEAAAADVEQVYADAGVSPDGRSLWELLDDAEEYDLLDPVDEAIASHERGGARNSERLAPAEEVLACEKPVGVCSLNCEQACHIALETHDLAEHVDAVVGRDTVPARKPDPAGLLAAVRGLSLSPDEVIFVGDTRSDERTAERAGVDFQYVEGGPREY